MKRWPIFASLVALSIASPALADDEDDETSGSHAPTPQRSAGGLDFHWWSAKGVESSLPTVFFLQYAITPNIVVHARLPFTVSVFPEIDGVPLDKQTRAHASLGNPMLGADFVKTFGIVTFHAGGLLGIPITEDGLHRRADILLAVSATALYDPYYWILKYFPLVGRVGAELRPIEALRVRGLLEPMVFFPIGDDSITIGNTTVTAQRDNEVYYQARAEAEYRISTYGFGGALQIVHRLSGTNVNDRAQTAAEPFVSFDSGTFYGRLGLLTALDEPAGFGFDRGKVMTLHVLLGGEFQ